MTTEDTGRPLHEDLIIREIERQPQEIQDFFLQMLEDGQTMRWAHMCAMQKAPMTSNTDRTFNSERRINMQNIPDRLRDKMLKIAKRAGINTSGKYYVGGLGRYTDPHAWISTVDDAKEVCKIKNLSAKGLVNHKGIPQPPPKKVAMAPDIKRAYVERALARDESLASEVRRKPSKLRDLEHKIVAAHARGQRKS